MGLQYCSEKREAGGSWNKQGLQDLLRWISLWDREAAVSCSVPSVTQTHSLGCSTAPAVQERERLCAGARMGGLPMH